jgi:DNA-binding NarL/FixJ family response regulator
MFLSYVVETTHGEYAMNSSESPIKVLVVEDHELARYGLVLALEEKASLTIVGEAENGVQAVDMVTQHHPSVVLMDIGMPIMDGITATQKIKVAFPEIKVIMLTSRKENEEVYAAFAAGADAYCMKDVKIDRLCQIIDLVLEGGLWVDPAIAKLIMQAMPGSADGTEPKTTVSRKQYNTELTDREQEVLQLIVDGKSNKEIAQILNFTTYTAKAHVSNIIQKLAVDDRTQVAVKALREGLVQSVDH